MNAEPPALPSSGLLAFIERASRDADFDIVKFGALLDRHEALVEKQQRAAFNAAMADVQNEIGRILRTGKNPTFVNAYARLEDLDRAARPIYSQHGFSVRYGSAPPPREGWLRVTLTIAHRDGYSEEHYLDGPIDGQGDRRRTAIQAVGSTVTYLRRYLLQMVLNLVPANDPADNDGERTKKPVNPDYPRVSQRAEDDPERRGTAADGPEYPFMTGKGGTIYRTASEWSERWRRLVDACRVTNALDKLKAAREMNEEAIAAVAAIDPLAAEEVAEMILAALEPKEPPAEERGQAPAGGEGR